MNDSLHQWRSAGPRPLQFSLAHLEAFVAIAGAGAIVRAAVQLHIAQPALSRKLRRLEEAVGAQLFVRAPHGVYLTAAGESFLQDAEMILDCCRQSLRNLRQSVQQNARTKPPRPIDHAPLP